MESGETAAMNYVWLADWFIDNYFYSSGSKVALYRPCRNS
jgi:hypothetical protein